MNARINFEKTVRTERNREAQAYEEFVGRKGKYNKTKRGGGVKGSFRSLEQSQVNQEKYFVGA